MSVQVLFVELRVDPGELEVVDRVREAVFGHGGNYELRLLTRVKPRESAEPEYLTLTLGSEFDVDASLAVLGKLREVGTVTLGRGPSTRQED